ncbi:hypothetical protein BDN67DRAFT_1060573 [Paxillus ammoniavirescens]|nr:hypothetical protein BDN67DRAFT_1060573 [Paxillus ammoniavirescens]
MANLDEVLDIPELTVDGRNWTTYQDSILHELKYKGLTGHYDGTETPPVHESGWSEWSKRDSRAKQLLATTIPDDIIYELGPKSLFKNSAHYFFLQLRILFEKSKPMTMTTATTMGRVERGCGEGEEGRKSRGRDDEKAATATGPGKGATDQRTGGISLVKPTSSQGSLPRARVDSPPHHHHSESPTPPPTSPTMQVEQPTPSSKRLTDQQQRNGHVLCNGTRRTREDGEGSQGREVQSRSRGCRADNNVHHGHVEPQTTQTTHQMAHVEATDPSNPNATGAGTMKPVGMSYGPPCESNEPSNESNNVDKGVESKEGEKGDRNERASGIIDPSKNSKNAIPDSIPPAPNPDELLPPPSMPLEGEKGQQSSGHTYEAATHLERLRNESNEDSKGEIGERVKRASGNVVPSSDDNGGDENVHHKYVVPNSTPPLHPDEVVVHKHDTAMHEHDDAVQSPEGQPPWGDQEGQETREVEGTMDEGEERRMAAMNANANGQYTSNEAGDLPPEPPPFPHHPAPPPLSPPPAPPPPHYPER